MKISKRVRRGYALALAALLSLPCLSMMQTQAAKGIDMEQECSLTVSVDIGSAGGSNDVYLEDFNQMSIPVSVYRAADVDVTGQKFTPVGVFAGTEEEKGLDFSGISGSSTAEDWLGLSVQAEAIREASSPETAGSVTIRMEEEGAQASSGKISGLTPGMYLVVPEDTFNPDYTVKYTFTPYLTALPGSAYALAGEARDDWVYDTVIGLKPEAKPQTGKLNITKVLENYNDTLGQTSFAFLIEGREVPGGPVVYSDVASTTHKDADSQTVTLDKIPAGLTMTVKEIYSGASYRIVGSDTDTALIWSDAAVDAGIAEGSMENGEASVTFTNEYDGGNRGGYGVTNHFDSDGAGGWVWENPTAPAEE